MVVFPNCKINLGLNIIRKRPDGYHDLETVFYPLPLTDALEVIQPAAAPAGINFSMSGLPVQGTAENNLCIKAYHLLKNEFPQIPPVQMHLHKAIPMGAGLGGGSADGAFTLKLLNDKFNLGINAERLVQYALQLGSDCPFFIYNKPCFATGRGEVMNTLPLDLSAYKIIIVNPGIHINTGWAFSRVIPALPPHSIKDIVQQPVEKWQQQLINDFEAPVLSAHPSLKELKEKLQNLGALYVSMSGSGSTFFGIFEKNAPLQSAHFPGTYFVRVFE
ncbi:4-(cytidine 5'-diphospho)-2-C-methyl-D-erythritol kinase [Panacibacter sp. DH6]|uniref:4-diphosphocytidyl-2-C-methyl-D-erythritol kinase n=1 Tax=Panacibacter microcysteis TaxID=2793269 RepID=A0A931E6L2_9BACT|nr:4-(cytidine 5'-diphospho)-2-C-methyl-D-erythritol kinase [Panacibacter microcysteis]